MAREGGLSVEMAARQARHEFLASTARQQGIRTIALAHQADDQVELFFLRLLRGAGLDGLVGMKPSAPSPADPRLQLIRPILTKSRAEVEAFARSQKVRFRIDRSNACPDMLRNRVRRELIPLLCRHYQPGLRAVILRLMDLAAADLDFLSQAAARSTTGKIPFDTRPLALQRRSIQSQLWDLGLKVDFDLVERLRKTAGAAVTAEGNVRVRRDQTGTVRRLSILGPEFKDGSVCLSLTPPRGRGEIEFEGCHIRWSLGAAGGRAGRFSPGAMSGREVFDAGKVGPDVILRHWRRGDRFQRIGRSRPEKLQDIFTKARVPRPERHRRVVAANGSGEIFWVEGLAIGERFKLDNQTAGRLKWAWNRGSIATSGT